MMVQWLGGLSNISQNNVCLPFHDQSLVQVLFDEILSIIIFDSNFIAQIPPPPRQIMWARGS